ncbi:hypothetical protein [Ensifer sp.]|jgi:hypothetical protein|uniref:hypothetical protein n=1 Tax=Ensifer sp. TaxID=1872086 RepID=UPI002E0FD677|nr:hypothetical protein [Ensifer sp.]
MDDEEKRHWEMIRLPVGTEWSGRARYAAAMFFYQRRQMDAETLEIYRICSRLDHEDPADVLRRYRIGSEWLARPEAKGDAPSDGSGD